MSTPHDNATGSEPTQHPTGRDSPPPESTGQGSGA